jgi:hypothetical protein
MFRRLGGTVLAVLIATTGFVSLSTSTAHAFVDRDCGDFDSQKQAQIFFLKHGGPNSDPHRLDDDGDGIACESNPAPYYYGTSLPDKDPQPTTVSSTVALSLSTSRAIQGEPVRLTATVKPSGRRTVVFQRRLDGRWRAVKRVTTTKFGKASHRLAAPKGSTTYRVVLRAKKAGNKRFTADTSRTRSLRVQRQRVELTLSRQAVDEGVDVRARVEASPVRKGRSIALQAFRAGTWKTIRTGKQNRRGVASFTVGTGNPGTFRYRAVALKFNGAVPARSAASKLVVRDTTPPPVPTGLLAAPGNESAQLTWQASTAADLDYYDVYYRTTGSSWQWVASPVVESWAATGLTNGVTYEFSVRSVDTAGNVSARSAAVSVTLTPPV